MAASHFVDAIDQGINNNYCFKENAYFSNNHHTLHAPQVVNDDGSQCDSDKSFLEGDRPSSSSSRGRRRQQRGKKGHSQAIANSGFVLDFVYKIPGVFKEFSRTRN